MTNDSLSVSDLKFAAHYRQGKQYLISGTRRNAFELTEHFTRDEIAALWDEAKHKMWQKAFVGEIEILDNEQELILKILDKDMGAIKFYENF